MKHGCLRRKVAMVLAPVGATALALGLTAGPAAAASQTSTVTFTDSNGATHTCSVDYDLFYFSTEHEVDVDIVIAGTTAADDQPCQDSFREIQTTYLQYDNGTQVTQAASGVGGSRESATYQNVKPQIDGSYDVTFDGCSSNCFVHYALSQPK